MRYGSVERIASGAGVIRSDSGRVDIIGHDIKLELAMYDAGKITEVDELALEIIKK